MPRSCAVATKCFRSSTVPKSGFTARWSCTAYGLPSVPLRLTFPIRCTSINQTISVPRSAIRGCASAARNVPSAVVTLVALVERHRGPLGVVVRRGWVSCCWGRKWSRGRRGGGGAAHDELGREQQVAGHGREPADLVDEVPAAASASAATGCRTVVRGGSVNSIRVLSSLPTIETSAGTGVLLPAPPGSRRSPSGPIRTRSRWHRGRAAGGRRASRPPSLYAVHWIRLARSTSLTRGPAHMPRPGTPRSGG